MAIEAGWLPDPEKREWWPELCEMLRPAAERGGCDVFVSGDLVWIAVDDGLLIGAATSRMTVEGFAELKHTAGTRAREWYPELESKICAWAKDCGADLIRGRGRRGWIPWITKLGWKVTGCESGLTLFEKVL
jgi:hypothetical protein